MKFPEFEEKMKLMFGEGTPGSVEELGRSVAFQYTTRIEIYHRPDFHPSRQWYAWVFGYDRTFGRGDSPAAAIADLAEKLSSKY